MNTVRAHLANRALRPRRNRQSRIPAIALLPALLLPLTLGPNMLLAAYACLVLSAGLALLWRTGEPPILLFVFSYQWLQAAMGPFYGNVVGLDVDHVAVHPGAHDMACFLLLTGDLVLALGMRLAAGKAVKSLYERIQAFVGSRPIAFWLRIYFVAWIFSAVVGTIAGRAGGLQQPLLALAQVKWAAFVLLTSATFAIPGRPRSQWLAVFGFEFILSLGGFFSDFKSVFFYALFGLAACNVRLSPRGIFGFAVLGGLLLWLGVIWTAVKGDYRAFVSGGTGQQVVVVGFTDRMQELGHLVGQLDSDTISQASDAFARRLMYYEFFGAAIADVPANVPHSGGAIWGEAITRPFQPRLLFEDKRAINDSDITNRYTGLSVATAEQGTSISMGSTAEAYIDFGPLLMFVPIAMLGAGLGYVYRWLLNSPGRDGVIGAALSTFAIMPAFATETSILKLIPALALCVLAAFFILRFAVPYIFRVPANSTPFRHSNFTRP